MTENIEYKMNNLPILRRKRILVFDVETTGLIPNIDPLTKKQRPLDEMPFIIQLSFIVFNLYEYSIERTYNAYIRIENPEKITEEITKLTGITREKCETFGIPMKDALLEFYNEYIQSDFVIAHNINFDRRMVMIEIERNYLELDKEAKDILNLFNPLFCKLKGIENYCTMMSGINICNILIEKKITKKPVVETPVVETIISSTDNQTTVPIIPNNIVKIKIVSPPKMYKKFPKLTELYFCLFQSHPENLHNALVDTLVCLRCFLKIKMNHEIHSKKYDHMLNSVMKIV